MFYPSSPHIWYAGPAEKHIFFILNMIRAVLRGASSYTLSWYLWTRYFVLFFYTHIYHASFILICKGGFYNLKSAVRNTLNLCKGLAHTFSWYMGPKYWISFYKYIRMGLVCKLYFNILIRGLLQLEVGSLECHQTKHSGSSYLIVSQMIKIFYSIVHNGLLCL